LSIIGKNILTIPKYMQGGHNMNYPRVRLFAVVVFCILILLTPFGGAGSAPVSRLTIGTASAGGTFYIIGAGMADILSKQLPNTIAVAEQTGGSVENINLLDNKDLDMAMAPTAIAIPAARGEKPFKKKMALMTGWLIYDAPLHIVALKFGSECADIERSRSPWHYQE
jgi:TRAP transporter TAXI family solute receptor